jgi:murein DD-endopeptidase MepM/ murein hydrolase activator NlpD
VVMAHLRAGSLQVAVGDTVTAGQHIADCGNSGNSTQPHVHIQVMDRPDASQARGLPMAFRRFREWPRGGQESEVRVAGVPKEGSVVEPLLDSAANGRS